MRNAGWLCVAFLLSGLAGTATAQETHLMVVTGVEGDQEHAASFHKWADALISAARKNDGVAEGNIIYLAEKPEADKRIRGRSTRENVEKAFADLAARVRPNDQVVIVLFGHGSFDGRQASFNLPGPDLSAAEYAKLLDRLPSARVVFVNTSSSSGGFLPTVAGPGRTIITATKTGGERNEPRFAEFFVEAFSNDAADKNRDGRVSVSEAFDYAKAKVTQIYQQAGNILTEHPTLEDGSNGTLASTLFLQSDRTRASIAATADPALRALLEERQDLEDKIAALKLRKATMDADEYEKTLEKLATDLALKTRAIQQAQGKKPTP